MQLLCLGDLALEDKPLTSTTWTVPGGLTPSADTQIMFNWEFPIGATLNSTPRVSGKRFLAYPDSVQMIKTWAPGIATVATNHVLDGGKEGLASTICSLQQAGFRTVGAGTVVEEIAQPLLWETAEGRLSIINWVFAETNPDWTAVPGPNCWPGFIEAKRTVQDLKRRSDWVLVVVHWSDELFPFPLAGDREIAQALANMGADIIIGHHPHVVRGMEIIGNCPVFYSLGNFYFAEKRDLAGDGTQEAPRNREGLGVQLTFQHGKCPEYELLSFWNDGREARRDWFSRASKRVKSTSRPLSKYHGDAYLNWYKTERARFNKWTSRWHFGLMRRGVIGTLQRIVEKLFKSPLMSR